MKSETLYYAGLALSAGLGFLGGCFSSNIRFTETSYDKNENIIQTMKGTGKFVTAHYNIPDGYFVEKNGERVEVKQIQVLAHVSNPILY